MLKPRHHCVRWSTIILALLAVSGGSAVAQEHDPRHWKGWRDDKGTNFMGCVAPQACGDKSIVSFRPQARQPMSLEEFRRLQDEVGTASDGGAAGGRLVSTSQRRVKNGTVLVARREMTDERGGRLQVVTGYVHTSQFTFSVVSSSATARHAAANFDNAILMLLKVLPDTGRPQ